MFKISIDTGGTFTDCLAVDSNGFEKRLKLLSKSVLRGQIIEYIATNQIRVSTNWGINKDFFEGFFIKFNGEIVQIYSVEKFDFVENIFTLKSDISEQITPTERTFELYTGEEVPVFASRILTQTPLSQLFPPLQLKLGSTKGTNALLESKGSKVLFLVTQGFKDLLVIGNQARPDIFALNILKAIPLYNHVLEVKEQIDSSGRIIVPVEIDDVLEQINAIASAFDSIAICFKNAYKNNIHEYTLAEILRQKYEYVSVSTELSSQIKFLNRAQTAVVNAYLSPIIDDYLKNISVKFPNNFLVMTSAGSLVNKHFFNPKDSLLSGPAGGVVGAAKMAQLSGYNHVITFDMGGTSTDVARYDNDFDLKNEITIGSATIFSPALAIETVAAGGGSICYFDGYKQKVGPESAGSAPGPACYGAGGPLTITDVNLLLVRMEASQFSIPINIDFAKRKLTELVDEINKNSEIKISPEAVLEGFRQIANENMAEAARKISVGKGYDPVDYALLAFGGAGGMHACALADLLHSKTVIIPADAGILSAFGISISQIEKIAERPVLLPFIAENISVIQVFQNELEKDTIQVLKNETNESVFIKKRTLKLRIKGQESSLEIDFDDKIDFEREKEQFKKKYINIYAHWPKKVTIEVENILVICSEIVKSDFQKSETLISSEHIPNYDFLNKSFVNGIWKDIPVYDRRKLKHGAKIKGFALLLDPYSTTVVEENWQLVIDAQNSAIISKIETETIIRSELSEQAELELFTNRFMSVAEQMGVMLQRTSLSVNVKERLDFSCAILDAKAQLIANAPHIPVHLGSLGVCVRSVLKVIDINKGDVVITNHPKYGGSHLPDITLISSVYTADNELVAYVVNRCHHAEIGGIRPASMPPNASNLEEEGVVIEPTYLVKSGVTQFDKIEQILANSKYPTRALLENMADISAALASNNKGSNALLQMVGQYGQQKVHYFMDLLKSYSSAILKVKLEEFSGKTFYAKELLDDGTALVVTISIDQSGNCLFDFEGTDSVHKGNLNANLAIVTSVIIYVLRVILNKNVPLNEGLTENIKIVIPENSILNPIFNENPSLAPAVVGGNVETSQRLTDTILKAFGLVACSQGTMNNTLFGNESFGYYETICGGSGAGEGFNGASAVHTHMTNTRITDPEIMELRYPVYLKRFEERINSGGKGLFEGGNGIRRQIEFLAPVKLSLLSQHRKYGPYGINGGESGKVGNQFVLKQNGDYVELDGTDAADLDIGDNFTIETPGGGGWG